MIKVLIVDDEEAVRQGLKMHLELEADIKIIGLAENGLEAVQLSNKLGPDVIVMDIKMDIMDGLEATRIIHESSPWISVIILTIYSDLTTKEKALESGAAAFLEKSGAANELTDLIHQISPI